MAHLDDLLAVDGVLLPGFNGTDVPGFLAQAPGLAGLLLFGHNTPDLETTRELTAALLAADPGLLIASDEEGGDVTRLFARDGSPLPGPAALGVLDDVAATEASGRVLGDLLAALGIDAGLGPVLDVASEPANPVIGVRSFGGDPALVARHGVAFTRGLQAAGVAACGKHFPGHGDTAVDSHESLPVLDLSDAELEARELVPFRAAFAAGLDSIMTGHLRVPAWGPEPASLNPRAAALARELGFEGVIITDALDMGAIRNAHGAGEACVLAIEAGADLLCLGNTSQPGAEPLDDAAEYAIARDALLAALASGRITRTRLEESGARVRALRDRVRAARGPVDLAAARAALDVLGADLAARAVTATGDVALPAGSPLVDARLRPDHAAGASSVLVRALTGVGLVPCAAAAVPSGARPAVLTREANDVAAAVLAAHPDAVVIHVGVAAAAPAAPNLVLAHGVGRANAEAVAALLRGAR